MDFVIPNLQWYLEQSISKGISPRCSFANVKSCPRFYQSLSLLGEAGSTKIPEKEDKNLLKEWERSPLWPVTQEQATSISGTDNCKHFGNFCPEVLFERFSLFTSHLCSYGDEIDRDCAHSQLSKMKANPDDWRWVWSSIKSQHYSECPLYSVLLCLKTDMQSEDTDIIQLKPNIYGIGLDIKALFRKMCKWWK